MIKLDIKLDIKLERLSKVGQVFQNISATLNCINMKTCIKCLIYFKSARNGKFQI